VVQQFASIVSNYSKMTRRRCPDVTGQSNILTFQENGVANSRQLARSTSCYPRTTLP